MMEEFFCRKKEEENFPLLTPQKCLIARKNFLFLHPHHADDQQHMFLIGYRYSLVTHLALF